MQPAPKPLIAILLPTFNGANFLKEQIESIKAQTHTDWILLCRDDQSTDQTQALLQQFQNDLPQKIRVIVDGKGNLGAQKSFASLLQSALDLNTGSAVYFALADQDDIWHPNKLSVLLETMQATETKYPQQTVLVHSDLRVVDELGEEISPHMSTYQGLQVHKEGFSAQLVSNTVTGCTSLLNRKLVELSVPMPDGSIMHDWWISLVACCFGQRVYVPQALVDYRQHTNNAVGAKALPTTKKRSGWRKPLRLVFYTLRLLFFVSGRQHNKLFQANAKQAKAFAKQFEGRLSATQQAALWLTRGLSIPIPLIQLTLFQILRR